MCEGLFPRSQLRWIRFPYDFSLDRTTGALTIREGGRETEPHPPDGSVPCCAACIRALTEPPA